MLIILLLSCSFQFQYEPLQFLALYGSSSLNPNIRRQKTDKFMLLFMQHLQSKNNKIFHETFTLYTVGSPKKIL